mmetsp:Transcript_24537/g.73647  ORF Transcript_24537/g.73647 Transcript_24537/m.73647 type:complete len:210 (-) Transcript_24537:1020-1649(-)
MRSSARRAQLRSERRGTTSSRSTQDVTKGSRALASAGDAQAGVAYATHATGSRALQAGARLSKAVASAATPPPSEWPTTVTLIPAARSSATMAPAPQSSRTARAARKMPPWAEQSGPSPVSTSSASELMVQSLGVVEPRKASTASAPRTARHQAGKRTGGSDGTDSRSSSSRDAPTHARSRQPSDSARRPAYHAAQSRVCCGARSSCAA